MTCQEFRQIIQSEKFMDATLAEKTSGCLHWLDCKECQEFVDTEVHWNVTLKESTHRAIIAARAIVKDRELDSQAREIAKKYLTSR